MIYTKSLGSLYLAEKTKPKSPDMKGTIKLQVSHLEQMMQSQTDDDVVVANIAAWQNIGKTGERYLTIELQPRQLAIHQSRSEVSDRATIFEAIDEYNR